MVLQQRKFTDGEGNVTFALEPGTRFPDEHAFTSDGFTELALSGMATMVEADTVKMTYLNGEATYHIKYRPGDPESEQIDAWVLELVDQNVPEDGAVKFKKQEISALEAGDIDQETYDAHMAHNKAVAKRSKGGAE